MFFLIFSCIVILAAGALLTWFISTDDFDGTWESIGVMEDGRLVPFAGGTVCHTLSFDEGYVAYFLNNEQMPATRKGRTIQVELAAQIFMEYRLSIREGKLIMTDPQGTQLVFEKLEFDDE